MYTHSDVLDTIGALGEEREIDERDAFALSVALPHLRLILMSGCHGICNRVPWFRANVITQAHNKRRWCGSIGRRAGRREVRPWRQLPRKGKSFMHLSENRITRCHLSTCGAATPNASLPSHSELLISLETKSCTRRAEPNRPRVTPLPTTLPWHLNFFPWVSFLSTFFERSVY
jgi:hypothetical protein